jgi:hypothetical protein
MRAGGGDGGLVTAVEALVLVQNGHVDSNIGRLEKAVSDFPQNHTLQGILGYAYAISGDKNNARKKHAQLANYRETNRKSNGYALAIVSMGLDNRQEAITWLETAYAEGALWSLGFRSDPILKPLMVDPRFERLVSRIGVTTQFRTETDFQWRASHSLKEDALLVENR